MTWIRKHDEPKSGRSVRHSCRLPLRGPGATVPPIDPVGEIWRCDDCGKLWQGGAYAFTPASLWQRIRYAGRGYPQRYNPEKIRSGGQMLVSTAMIPEPKDAPPPPPSGARR